jgi:hypothetical protein
MYNKMNRNYMTSSKASTMASRPPIAADPSRKMLTPINRPLSATQKKLKKKVRDDADSAEKRIANLKENSTAYPSMPHIKTEPSKAHFSSLSESKSKNFWAQDHTINAGDLHYVKPFDLTAHN